MTAGQRKRAEYYLRSASRIAEEARQSYKNKSYDRVIRLTQEAVELFLKAKILKAGGEPAKTHDVVDLSEALESPPKASARDLQFLSEARIPSFYGADDFIPDLEYTDEDASRCLKILKKMGL